MTSSPSLSEVEQENAVQVGRRQFYGSRKIRYRRCKLSLIEAHEPTVRKGIDMLGIELDRFIIILNRPVVISLMSIGIPPIIESICMLRIEPERFIVILNRPVVVSLASVGDTPVSKGVGIFGIRLDCVIVCVSSPSLI